jgi:predicted SAM-dependent methyltransferase
MKLLSDQVTEIKYLNELPKGIKLNIGSGFKRIEGYLNVDDDPLVEPDVNVHLDDVNLVLPFDNDSVSVVHAHHILEHIGDGFIRLFQELYRVCKNGAIIDILVPHHTHENFFGDVTHKRPITPNAMMQFGKKYCQN